MSPSRFSSPDEVLKPEARAERLVAVARSPLVETAPLSLRQPHPKAVQPAAGRRSHSAGSSVDSTSQWARQIAPQHRGILRPKALGTTRALRSPIWATPPRLQTQPNPDVSRESESHVSFSDPGSGRRGACNRNLRRQLCPRKLSTRARSMR